MITVVDSRGAIHTGRSVESIARREHGRTAYAVKGTAPGEWWVCAGPLAIVIDRYYWEE